MDADVKVGDIIQIAGTYVVNPPNAFVVSKVHVQEETVILDLKEDNSSDS